jgi:hypothetical protein
LPPAHVRPRLHRRGGIHEHSIRRQRRAHLGGDGRYRDLVEKNWLIKAAPADMVAALGAFDRRLYVVPSRQLVVVRAGADARDTEFDQQLWLRLIKVIG